MLIVITIVQSDAHDLVALSIKSSEELIPYRQEKRVILVQMLFVHRVVHMVIVRRDNKPATKPPEIPIQLGMNEHRVRGNNGGKDWICPWNAKNRERNCFEEGGKGNHQNAVATRRH